MRLTENRHTDLNDLKLNLPEERLRTEIPNPKVASRDTALADAREGSQIDSRPVRFTSPTYQPLTPDRMVVVHPKNSNTRGGFFGPTRIKEGGGPKRHGGVDIETSNEKDRETGVMAAEDGVVSRAGHAGDYGNLICIDHRDGYQTRYAHLSRIDVKAGQKVAQGELIGNSGKTGNANSPEILSHLHFEIRKDGQAVDPVPLITTVRPDRKLFLMVEGLNGGTP